MDFDGDVDRKRALLGDGPLGSGCANGSSWTCQACVREGSSAPEEIFFPHLFILRLGIDVGDDAQPIVVVVVVIMVARC